MTIFTDGARVQGQPYLEDAPLSWGETIGAAAGAAWHELPTFQAFGIQELGAATGVRDDIADQIARVQRGESPSDVMDKPTVVPEMPIADAKARVKEAGLDRVLHLPDQPTIRKPAFDIMLKRAQEKRERDAVAARGAEGFVPNALAVGTSFLVGAVDPLNIASAFIPVVGELRYAKLMADAGASAVSRAGVRAGVGAASGAVGSVPLIGLEAAARSREGQDFTMADALRNLIFGTVLGGTLHSGGGAVADVVRRRKGQELFPFRADEPFAARPAGGEALGSPPVAPEAARTRAGPEGDFAAGGAAPKPAESFEPSPVVRALDDLPPRAKEDAMRAAIADLVEGRPVAAGELLEAAARTDPRIAESIETWHGSPHDVIAGPRAARGPRARDPETWSLAEFLASRGGLDPTDPLIGDIRHSIGASNKFVPGFGHLIRKGGMRLDQAREAAVEAGYIRDNGDITGGVSQTTVKSLLDAVDGELRGSRVYREGREPVKGFDAEQNRIDIEREAHGALRDEGIEGVPDKTMARVVEIMEREGERDPLIAYERAVMEETHYGAETGFNERIGDPIPGWDLPHDAGAAPGAGRAAQEGGQRHAVDAAREAGEGHRGAQRAAGDRASERVADWQRLAARAGEVDDPAILEASRAAEKLQEPASADPGKRVQAAENAAAIADQQYKDAAPYLPEDLRERVEAELKALEEGSADANEVIRRGAACLAAAVGAAA